jgi:hypothetical protein
MANGRGPSDPGGEPLCKMAALSDVSRRLPGMTQHKALVQRVYSEAPLILARPVELPYEEPFPGAACCQPAELVTYKAAPLPLVFR